jgi:alanine racemase
MKRVKTLFQGGSLAFKSTKIDKSLTRLGIYEKNPLQTQTKLGNSTYFDPINKMSHTKLNKNSTNHVLLTQILKLKYPCVADRKSNRFIFIA